MIYETLQGKAEGKVMINVFWMIYHQGKAHWDNKWHMAGELA